MADDSITRGVSPGPLHAPHQPRLWGGPGGRFLLATWIGVLLCLIGLMAQRLPLPWPRRFGFLSVSGLIFFGNLFWWSWVDHLLIAPLQRPRARRAWRAAWSAYILLMLVPIVLLLLERRWWDAFPVSTIMWIMGWNLFLAGLAAAAAIAILVRLTIGLFRKAMAQEVTDPTAESDENHAAAASAGSESNSAGSADISESVCEERNLGGMGNVLAAHVRSARAASTLPMPPGTASQSGSEIAAEALPIPMISRRRMLMGAAVLPFVGGGAALLSGKAQEGRFLVRRIAMKLPRLPDRLRGLTISHVSDLHTGRLFRPEHLPAMIDAVNAFKSDLVVVTGDIIDHSNDFLPAACEALGQLEHRYGRYLVVGNHDLIDDPSEFARYVQKREPHFLVDRHVKVNIGGEPIQIAGLAWSTSDGKRRGDPGHFRRAAAALSLYDPDLFTLALVHHPHAFDALAPQGVDLTLAGHTHGGQLMLTPPGFPVRIGAGSAMFRYIWGEYYQGRSALYVNAGVGNWFPVRVNAPAEIVQIQLV